MSSMIPSPSGGGGGGGVGGVVGGGGGGGGGALEGSFSVGEPQRPLNRDPV